MKPQWYVVQVCGATLISLHRKQPVNQATGEVSAKLDVHKDGGIMGDIVGGMVGDVVGVSLDAVQLKLPVSVRREWRSSSCDTNRVHRSARSKSARRR